MQASDKLQSPADMRAEERWIAEYLRGEMRRRELRFRCIDRCAEVVLLLGVALGIFALLGR